MRVAVGVVSFCLTFLHLPSIAQSHDKGDSLSKIECTKTHNTHQDTVRALEHLFQRKRKSTRIKAAVVGLVIDVLLIRMWTHPHTLPQGGQAIGTPVVTSGSSVPVANYVATSIATAVIVEIIAQRSYGKKKLKSVLSNYDAGKPIPSKIKSKIAARDFY